MDRPLLSVGKEAELVTALDGRGHVVVTLNGRRYDYTAAVERAAAIEAAGRAVLTAYGVTGSRDGATAHGTQTMVQMRALARLSAVLKEGNE